VTLLPPNTATRMPRIAHFIFGLSPDFGNKPFSLVHYLAIRSAHDRLGTDWKIFVSGRAAAAAAQRQQQHSGSSSTAAAAAQRQQQHSGSSNTAAAADAPLLRRCFTRTSRAPT
jgi:hypothetical protein